MRLSISMTKATVRPELLRQAVSTSLLESGALVEKVVRQRAPVGVGGHSGFRGSIFSEVRESPLRQEAVIGSPLPYAQVIEFGRRPGQRRPPVAALLPWVEKFVTLEDGETAEGVAFVMARAIGRRGIPARPLFATSLQAARPFITAIFRERVGEVSVKLIRKG